MTALIPSVEHSSGLRLVPLFLSLIAGCVDVIGFLWHGTFVAHITGNLILVAARVVAGTPVGLATILSVPVFVIMVGVVNTASVGLVSADIPSLRPLLVIQFVFLAGFFGAGMIAGTHGSSNSPAAVIALMLGVCALATQNALAQTSIRGAPSTAVMTTNLTRFRHDLTGIFFGNDRVSARTARTRASQTWPSIAGFAGGAAAGAGLYAAIGVESLVLPVGLALVVLALPGRLQIHRARQSDIDARSVVRHQSPDPNV
jgi:uncharacterized membrane protein YoaK (UPF0700 family)